MSDAKHPDLVCAKSEGVKWRVFELECCQEFFGITIDANPVGITADKIRNCGARVMSWKLHTEITDEKLWLHCCRVADDLPDVKHINDPRHWLACHAKEVAFGIWQKNGIPVPKWFEFTDGSSFWNNVHFDFPMLLRLNNSTSGAYSYLVNNRSEVKNAIVRLTGQRNVGHDGSTSTGTRRKMIAVQFIPTTRPERVNMSFRIIVAGDKVVTGYARLGPAADWIAITGRFEPWMQEPFIKYQKVCQDFCQQNEALIVKAVRVLGLNFQGVDVILDKEGKPYFLEVQPGFSVGYADVKAWKPPFYNPSHPESLVAFLKASMSRLKAETPMYANMWLNKFAMFNEAYRLLRKDLYGNEA